jgi:Small protein A (tmRNA-binding)
MIRSRKRGQAVAGTLLCASLIALTGLSLGACEGRVAIHGNPIDPDELARLAPGSQSKADVVGLLGSPSSTPAFDDKTWYYISDRERTLAFLAPETEERQIVALSFDDNGVLASVETFGLERGQEVEVVSRETPSFGQSPTIIQQMLGNLGKFNKADNPRR